jgi:hypothetical protein
MKSRRRFTPGELQAIRNEAAEQAMKFVESRYMDIDSIFCYSMHELYGFGQKRLKRLYLKMQEYRNEMLKHYDPNNEDPDISEYVMRRRLSECGIDMKDIYDAMEKVEENEDSEA